MKNRSLRKSLTAFMSAVALATFAANAYAVLKVVAMPSGQSTPANAWDSRPYTWPGNNLELWGRVSAYDGAKALTYTWNFGAGEGSSGGTVTNQANIAASHNYGGTGTFTATLTVTDVPAGGTETASATVFVDVVPQTMEVQKNLVIQRALKKLYTTRGSATRNGCATYYWSNTDTYGDTGLAVLAFEDYNHRASNDPDQDIYADTVNKGLHYLESYLLRTSAANTVNTDSDLNSNTYKTYVSGGNGYDQGIWAMAIANSNAPGRTATCSTASHVQGMTYQTILEDMVDYIAYMQQDTGVSTGGWRYSANGGSDNSVAQWPVLGLTAAGQAPWNIAPPSWVKAKMPTWINYSQSGSGGFGYTYAGYWDNVAKTGSGIIQMSYAGSGGNTTNAINFIGANWCSTSYDYGNLADHYAMYAVKKGLQYAGITQVNAPACAGGLSGYGGTPTNWQSDYDKWYVNNQVGTADTNGGYWSGSVRIGSPQTSTALGLLVLSKGLTESPPVAMAGGDQDVPPGVNVSFNGSASYHTDLTKAIVLYQWDYDFDGATFDVDATGPMVTKAGGFTLPSGVSDKVYTVALRVTDNNSPALTARDTLAVTVSNGNQAPVAMAGGPYGGAVGEDIALNGTGSYDANSVGGSNPIANALMPSGFDEIVSYEWDLDGDGVYGVLDGEPVGATPLVNFGSFIGTKTVSLKVTDSFGKSGVQSSSATTVAISNVQPMCYVRTLNAYNPFTKTWTHGWKLKLENVGTASASSITATLTTIPPGVTVLDGALSWAGAIAPAGSLLSSDDFRYRFKSPAPDLTQMTWDIELTDSLGARHVIRQIPQGSGTCP